MGAKYRHTGANLDDFDRVEPQKGAKPHFRFELNTLPSFDTGDGAPGPTCELAHRRSSEGREQQSDICTNMVEDAVKFEKTEVEGQIRPNRPSKALGTYRMRPMNPWSSVGS